VKIFQSRDTRGLQAGCQIRLLTFRVAHVGTEITSGNHGPNAMTILKFEAMVAGRRKKYAMTTKPITKPSVPVVGISLKRDDLSPDHLAWLVASRTKNQSAALKLFKLLDSHGMKMRSRGYSQTAQDLVSVCFSLWRAAFLADRVGTRSAIIDDARTFLGKMLVDNAITYQQDRSSREWTFNYYMRNATHGLLTLGDRWGNIKDILKVRPNPAGGATAAQRRWNRSE
jgi:hypothetical protein